MQATWMHLLQQDDVKPSALDQAVGLAHAYRAIACNGRVKSSSFQFVQRAPNHATPMRLLEALTPRFGEKPSTLSLNSGGSKCSISWSGHYTLSPGQRLSLLVGTLGLAERCPTLVPYSHSFSQLLLMILHSKVRF